MQPHRLLTDLLTLLLFSSATFMATAAGNKDWQAHGSIYGVVPAKRGHLKPVGE
jgi:hypothetical protein